MFYYLNLNIFLTTVNFYRKQKINKKRFLKRTSFDLHHNKKNVCFNCTNKFELYASSVAVF